MDADATFLMLDTSNTISLASAHATTVADQDVIFTTDADTTYLESANDDAELRNVWGYDAAVAANGRSTNSRIVLKFNVPTGEDIDVLDALAFVYTPTVEEVSDVANITNVVRVTDDLATNAALAGGEYSAGAANTTLAGEVAQLDSDGDGVLTDETNVIIELPDYEASAGAVRTTDKLVIQNIEVGGVRYSVHINAPAISNAATSSTENASGLTYSVYRHVFLNTTSVLADFDTAAPPVSGALQDLAVGASYTAALPSFSGTLVYREELAAAKAANVVFSTTGAVDDDTTAFTGTNGAASTTTSDQVVSLSTTAGAAETVDNSITYTLNALTAGSISETVNKVVGRDSVLTITAADHSGNTSSTVMTLKKGHGRVRVNGVAGVAGQEIVLLNTISGNSIEDL
jgi:hypothetical protein